MAKWRPLTEQEQIDKRRASMDRRNATLARLRAKRKPWRYAIALERIANDDEHAGQFFKIAEWRKQHGTLAENSRAALLEAKNVRQWLTTHRPTEVWRVSYRQVPETWSDFDLYVAYLRRYPNKAAKTRVEKRLRAEARQG